LDPRGRLALLRNKGTLVSPWRNVLRRRSLDSIQKRGIGFLTAGFFPKGGAVFSVQKGV